MTRFLTILLIIAYLQCDAQTYPVTSINISLPINPDANTANWGSGTSPFIITANARAGATGVDATVRESKILVIIKKKGTIICGAYTGNTAPAANFNSPVKVWSGNNAASLLGQTCVLPSGDYELSVQFFGYGAGKTTPISDEKTKAFTIKGNDQQAYQGPQTIVPANGSLLTGLAQTSVITFRWIPVVPRPIDNDIVYNLRIYEILQGQQPGQAIKVNSPILEQQVNIATQYAWAVPAEYRVQGITKHFVWNVQGTNKEGKGYGPNSGTSGPSVFDTGNTDSTSNPGLKSMTIGCATTSTKHYAIGDSITLSDNFKLKFTTTPTGTNDSLSGKGTVRVKWLGTLNVNFKGIKINEDEKLCSGSIYTNTDSAQVYPTQWAINVLHNTGVGSWTVNKIKTISGKIKTNKLLKPLIPATNQLNTTITVNPINMPLGYFKSNDTTTAIGITEMVFSADHAEFEAIASLNTTGIFKKVSNTFNGTDAIALHGNGIHFTNSGLSSISGSIVLAQPITFTYANTNTENLKLTFNTDSNGHVGNGVTFSGDSTAWIYNFDADVQLPKQWLTPVDTSKANVSMNFQLAISIWDDFILQGSLPACIIPHTNGVGIDAGTIIYDHSAIINADAMVFPDGYTGDTNDMFTGFYLKNFKFTLPDQLRSYADTTKNIQVGAENLIIDKEGLTGKVYAYNVLNYPKANIGNLGASIDTVKISFVSNALTQASMLGKITLPLSKTDNTNNAINYSALFVSGNSSNPADTASIIFALKPAQDITANFLGDGKVQIDQTSTLNLKLLKINHKRSVTFDVDLNGKLSYSGGKIKDFGSNIPLDLDLSCTFQHLSMSYKKVPGESFSFNPGQWSFASPQKKLSGFAFTITNVVPKIDLISGGAEKQYLFKGGIEFVAKINIGSENSNIAISGDTKISLAGAIESNKYTPPSTVATTSSISNLNVITAQSQTMNGSTTSVNAITNNLKADYGFLTQLQPIYLGVNVESIHIESHMPAVYIKGSVDFYKHDPVYGNGFKGKLTAKFTTLDLGIQAGAIFGNTKYIPNNIGAGFKYWMVEAQVNLPPPGIIFLTGVAFRGFGAGVYSRMHMTVPAVFNPTEVAASTFGGAVFTPDISVSMGFKAKAIIATTPKEETFNGSVALSAQFNTNGGMNFIQFDGLFNCGAKIGNEADAFANGSITVAYNFPQKLFDMTSTLLINKDPISTDPPGIQTKLHIDGLHNQWFFMSGTPSVPNKVKILNVAINSYLMFGNDIEIPQGFMQETRAGFASIGHNLPSFNDNATGEGKYQSAKGFAFGIGLNYDKSDNWNIADYQLCNKCPHRYLNINYSIAAGGEIDASFLQYTGCVGMGEGWRAKASMAVYAGVTLGYSYSLPVLGDKSGILGHIAGSAYATAEFPKPTFFDGQLDGDFSIGGYSVSFHKHFQSGSQCGGSLVEPDPSINQNVYTQQDVSDSLSYILIKDIMIANGSTNISRTTNFAVYLNYPANETFDIQEQQSSGQIKVRTFRVLYTPVLTQDSISTAPMQMSAQVANHASLLAGTGSASTSNNNTGNIQSVNHAPFSTASSSTNNLNLINGGYDDMGAKIYKRGGTGKMSVNVTPLKSNTSYKFQITGQLQEKTGNVWKAVNHKNTAVPVKQIKNVYFKTNTASVSTGPTQMPTGSNVLQHH